MAIIEYAKFHENIISNVNHMHTSCELIYMASGRIEILQEMPFYAEEGDCLLIKSRQHHNIRVDNDIEYKRLVAFINPWELRKQLVRPDLFAMLTDISRSGYVLLKNALRLRDGFERMKDIFENGGNIYEELSAALSVVSAFYEKIKPRKSQNSEHSAKRLSDRVRTYIEQNYADNIKISKLAKQNFISEGYLTHAFKSETGMSPREYLSHIRCTRAYELICHTDMKFADISCNTGFCCANDMSKKIREYYGRTPTQIRLESAKE